MSMLIDAYRFGGGGGPTDPYWASVTSLLHFDAADGSTTFTDQKGITWSRGSSNAEIDTAESKFGGSSLFSNTTGYLGAPTAGNFDFGTGDFTLECWVKPSSIATYQTIFNHRNAGGNRGITFRITNSGKLEAFRDGGLNIMTGTTTLSTTAFQHVALSRVGTTWRIFLEGVEEGSNAGLSGVDVSTDASATSYIGVYGDFSLTTERLSSGWIDEFRATKGVGRYASGFTPPAAAFPDS